MKIKEITCISDLYYVYGRWMTFAFFIIAFATLPFALEMWPTVFSFLMCASIAFVGCAADYKDKFDYPIHYISASISAISSIIWVWNMDPTKTAFLYLIIAFFGIFDRKRWLLWCELPCFLMVYTVLILRHLFQEIPCTLVLG